MNLFVKIMIVVGLGILTTESNGVVSSDALNLFLAKLHTIGLKRGSQNESCRRKISKRKLGLFLSNRLDSVVSIYDIEAALVVDSNLDDYHKFLFFTAKANSGDTYSKIRCNLDFSNSGGHCSAMLLQNCQSSEVVFLKTEIEVPFSAIEGEGRVIVD